MKIKLSKVLSIVLAILMIVSVVPVSASAASEEASGVCGDNLTWSLDSEGVLTISGEGNMTDFSFNRIIWTDYQTDIKKVIIGDNVTSIGSYAFDGCRFLTDVEMGKNITKIGASAFSSCEALSDITIPEGVTDIEEDTFSNSGITNIAIPAGVTYIDISAFNDCKSLTAITVDKNNTIYSNDEYGVLFDKEKTQIIKCPQAIEGSYVIPDSVTSIGKEAFICCSFSEIVLPDSITTLGDSVFMDCKNLTAISLPDSITETGHSVFAQCTALKSVKFSENMNKISSQMFIGCTSLTEITVPDIVDVIEPNAFAGCVALEKVTLPDKGLKLRYQVFSDSGYYNDSNNWEDGALYIGKHLIKVKNDTKDKYSIKDGTLSVAEMSVRDTGITSIYIPDSVVLIADDAFCYSNSLTEISVSSDNKEFTSEDGILYSKNKDTIVFYPGGITEASFTVPDIVAHIGNNAFCGNKYLKSVILHDRITSIGSGAFYMCAALSEMNLPENLECIEPFTFFGCSNLKSIIIPSSVSLIREWAFENCGTLTEVFIPVSVEKICSGAFRTGNNALKNVYYGGSEEEWKEILIESPDDTNSCFKTVNMHYNCCPANKDFQHSYSEDITAPSCTEKGYTTNTCACGDCYITDYTEEKPHFTLGWVADEENGVAVNSCRDCDYKETIPLADYVIASGACGENLTWELFYDGTLVISGYGEMDTDSYDPDWSSHKENIKKVTLPEGLTSINSGAFGYCQNLTEIRLPETLETLNYAIEMTAVRELYIPASVKNIQTATTAGGMLEKIVVDENNPYYSSDEYGVLYNKDKTEVLMVPVNIPLTSFTVPDGVVKIGSAAFGVNLNLKEVIMPESLKEIGEYAFIQAPYIEKVKIPEGVEIIGGSAFVACGKLDNVTVPASVKSVGFNAFGECYSLRKLTFLSKDAECDKMAFGYLGYGYADDEERSELSDVLAYYIYRSYSLPFDHEELKEIEEKVFSFPSREEDERTKDTCTVYCYEGSTAHTFAVENGVNYVLMCDHDKAVLEAVEPTCTEAGLSEGSYCTKCGEIFTAQEAVPEKGHSHEAVVTAPTCTEEGFTIYTCICGDSYTTDYTDAFGHTMGEWTVDGSVKTRTCSVCFIKETVFETDDGNVEIEAPENPDLKFDVDEIKKDGDNFVLVQNTVTENNEVECEVLKVFDINLKNHDGVHVQPDGSVKVKLPLDWEKDGNYKVYRVNDDGTLTDMKAFRQGSHMVFETDHFSIYVVVEEEAVEEPSEDKENTQSGEKDVFLFLTRLVRALEMFFMSILEILGF